MWIKMTSLRRSVHVAADKISHIEVVEQHGKDETGTVKPYWDVRVYVVGRNGAAAYGVWHDEDEMNAFVEVCKGTCDG